MIQGFQNGELIRRGNSDERLWQDERLVRWLATWMTLEPWDVILTGAPVRVVPRRYLKDGDEFVVRIDGLGELRNRFREDS
jgi:2-keto-4-pentenoate hydratase/2-oxohepta-3-ene-1,7-dioic acid hydratase in catechol pathway